MITKTNVIKCEHIITINYYEYNNFNQLKRVREGNATSPIIEEYMYDHEGKRILKKTYTTNETTFYISENFVRVSNSSGIFDTVYYYDEKDLVARKDPDGKKFFYHPDHLGSTTLITNESGDVVEETTYEPFGKIIEGGNDRFLYTGKELDRSTNLEYYGARYYSPELGRFVEPDSNLPNVYDPQQLNRYAYTRNNPYKYVDKDGNSYESAVMFIGGFWIGYGTSFMMQYQTGKVDLGRAAISGISTGTASALVSAAGSFGNSRIGNFVFKQTGEQSAEIAINDVLVDTFFHDSPGRNIETGSILDIVGNVVQGKEIGGLYVPPGGEFGLIYYPGSNELLMPTSENLQYRQEKEQKMAENSLKTLNIDTKNLDVGGLLQNWQTDNKGLSFNDYAKKYYKNYVRKDSNKEVKPK